MVRNQLTGITGTGFIVRSYAYDKNVNDAAGGTRSTRIIYKGTTLFYISALEGRINFEAAVMRELGDSKAIYRHGASGGTYVYQ